MGSIRSSIELQDNFTSILMNVINAVNMSVSTMEQMQSVMNDPIDTAAIQGMRDQLNQATVAARELEAAMQDVGAPDAGVATARVTLPVEPSFPPGPLVDQPAPVEVPVVWQSNGLDVFTNSGVERFEQEVQSVNNMLGTLNQTQADIAARAAQANIFPPGMVTDMDGVQNRLQAIQSRLQAIENNPLNMGTDTANAELEQLRGQLDQAVQEQQNLNRAVDEMDVQAANEAYLRLSRTIGSTERYIRDNVDEQGRFNREIQKGVDSASDLRRMIGNAVGAFAGMAGLKRAKDWIDDCTSAFNTQLNAEMQLISVLSNMLDEGYVSQFELETTADTTAAIDEINAIQNGVDGVTVPVTAETRALTAAFDRITAKASEIQGRGIYGDEAMIAAAAEFSTYFTDTGAIEMMMDTLANYAMGMTGGGEIDSAGMVEYATNLGKIMSGSYDAMTKKGFEFSDAQKAIIEGEATREQIVASLGEEYVNMSSDMQAAAAITQVIDEAWAGLYESMSNTPEGRIIQLNNAWGDMKEIVGGQLYPFVLLFVDVIENNWGTIEAVVQAITTGLEYMLGVLSWILEGAMNFAQVVIDNWGWISPVIYGIAGALAVYYGWQMAANAVGLISKGIHMAIAAAQMIHAAVTGTLTAATAAEIAAQNGLNAAMYACPIVWIIVLIIALIAAFYAAVEAVNHFAHTSVSATGIICGAVAAAGAFILNTVIGIINGILQAARAFAEPFISIVEWILNVANGGFDSFGGAVANLIGNIISWFLSLGMVVTRIIDAIFGTDWTSGLSSLQDTVLGWGKNENAITLDRRAPMIDYRIGYGDAWDAGYSFGERIEESISNFDPSSLFGTTDIPSAEDYAGALSAGGLGGNVDDIAGNTGAMADAMEITGEELKYLRDIAEQEAVNRFTTAEVSIEQTNHNTIKNGMDLDGIMSGMTDMVYEAINISTEGVHV